MSTTIDERVVSMQFDNRHFEKNASTSINTLGKLRQSLDLSGAAKGLEEINDISKRTNFSILSDGVETVKAKFSALQIIGITALQNITNSAINTGKRLVSSLTIDPIKTGLAEYETQLNSVQTILANTESKGSTLEDVNAALDELNTYADKTIYNFTQMTRNIGTFTAAGVDLDTSVAAIKGIANLAAVSGSTSQQASTAMYQLSQALASGTVKLMDWNSVVNAGMGGQVFQDALKETARLHGVAIDDMIKNEGSFRETLKEGWLTKDILTETLSKFTGDLNEEQLKSMGYTEKQIEEILKLGKTANDAATKVKTFTQLLDTLKEGAQSGWAQTWEIIIGDFEEAKELWTNVSDVIGGVISSSSDARNKLISGALDSGWDKLLNAGIMDEKGYSHHIKAVAKESGIAIDEMIEKEGSLEKALRKGFESGEISSDVLSTALGRLSKAYSNCSAEELKNLGYTQEQVDKLVELNTKVQNGSISMEEFAESIGKLSGRESIIESFSNLWKSLLSIVTPIKEAFSEIFPPATSDQLYNLIEIFRNFTSKLILTEEQSEKLKRTFKGLFAVLDIVVTVVKTLASAAFKVLGSFTGLGNGILDVTASIGDYLLKIRDSIKESGSFANIVKNMTDSIVNFISSVKEKIGSSGLFSGIFKGLKAAWAIGKAIFAEMKEIISGMFDSLSNGEGGSFLDVFNTILAGGIVYKLIDIIKMLKDKSSGLSGIIDVLKAPFEGIGDVIDNVTGALSSFQDKLKAETIKTLAVSVAILAGSIFVLSLIDKEKLTNAMSAIVLSFGLLLGSLTLFQKIDKQGLGSIKTLLAISSSLLILSLALKVFATMSWSEIARGLTAMTGVLVILLGTLTLANLISKLGDGGSVKKITAMAAPLIILALALKIFGTMSWDSIARGLTAMAGTLVILAGTLALLNLISKSGDSKGVGKLIAITFTLITVAAALKIFGTMSWKEIVAGLTAMGGAFTVLVSVLFMLDNVDTSNATKGIIQLMALSTILLTLSVTLKILSTMGWNEIGRSLTAMGGALVILIAALALMSKISGGGSMLASAAAILVLAGALTVLVGVLLALGNMKTGTIVKGLVTIAAALVIIGGAGVLFSAAVPAILAFAGAMTALGVALVLVGAGFTLISTGLGIMLTSMGSGMAILLGGLMSFLKSVVELIPIILISVAEGIVGFCRVLAEGAPSIGQAIAQLLLAAINACVVVIPELANGLLLIVVGVLDSLVEFTPQIVESLVNLLIGVLKSLVNAIPKLIVAAVEVISQFFDGIIDALKNINPDALLKTLLSIGLLAALMAALSAIVSLIPGAMVGVLGMGVVIAELALVLAAIGALSKIPGLNDLIADGGNLLQTIGTAIGQFIGGILGGVAQGFTSSLPAIGTDLSNFMTNLQPFINGLRLIDASTLESAKTLASLILVITAASIIDSLTSWLTGGASMADFADEIATFGGGIKKFAEEVKGIDGETVKAAAEAGKNLGQMAKAIPTSGGLWDLIAGKNDLTSFGDQLGSFGKGVKNFANEVKGIDGEAVKSAAEAGKTLGQMASKLPTSGGLWNAIKGENGMGTFSANLTQFGAAIKNFVAEMNGVGDVSVIASKVETLNTSLNSFAVSGLDSVADSLTASKNKIAHSVSGMIQGAISEVKSKSSSFASAGKTLITKFIDSINSYKSKVKKAFTTIISESVSAIKTKNNYNKFYDAGEYLVGGLADGISENAQTVIDEATKLANSVNKALTDVFRINSPSKETYEDGEYLVTGLTNSLKDNTSKAYKASGSMAEKVLEGMKLAYESANSLLADGVDDQPTIKPVIDLSEVAAGANSINGMFGMVPSVGVLSTVSGINTSMSKNQNGSGYDVASSIKDLSNTLKNNPTNVYNINGVTYDDGSALQLAIETIVRNIIIEGRR